MRDSINEPLSVFDKGLHMAFQTVQLQKGFLGLRCGLATLNTLPLNGLVEKGSTEIFEPDVEIGGSPDITLYLL